MFDIIATIETSAGTKGMTWEKQTAEQVEDRREHINFIAPIGSTITFIVREL